MPAGWDPDIGKDPAWWLGVIAGFCLTVGAGLGALLDRLLFRHRRR